MKERTVSATSENSQDKPTVPLLVEVVIWIQTVANVSSSAALYESSTLLDSHTMQSQKSASWLLILQYATPATACYASRPASYQECLQRGIPSAPLSAYHVLQPLFRDVCLCSQMLRCVRAVELGECSQMLRCIRAVKLGGRCASSSAFSMAAVDGVSTGTAATLHMSLRPPVSGILLLGPAFVAESGGRPAGCTTRQPSPLCSCVAMPPVHLPCHHTSVRISTWQSKTQ